LIGFELLRNSGLGRLGKLMTPHGTVITPELMPVYNPNIPLISTKELIEQFDVKILITNAYIINRSSELREEADQGVHNLINFPRVIMLDSGAYQAWMYKKELSVSNSEIIRFQERLSPDIATILDVFTDTDNYDAAKFGVDETIKRAEECVKIREESEIMWAAPIQGGKFFDLIEYCSKKLSALDFNYHPLGTLAPALMNYEYRPVLEAIATAKLNMDISRPLHAFSIGHPMFFALSVLFGSDLFDSSSYALYAKGNRYITPTSTLSLENMVEFPCSCPTCLKYTPQELRECDQGKKRILLAKHNLFCCLDEMKRIREAIRQDKLWELVQSRIRAHPNLLDAYLHSLMKFYTKIEEKDPITKRSAFFYVGKDSIFRPEIVRYSQRIFQRYSPPEVKLLFILPDIITRPIESQYFKDWYEEIKKATELNSDLDFKDIHICILSPIFGIIPLELSETYPLSQHLYPNIFLEDLSAHMSKILHKFIQKFKHHYRKIFLLYPNSLFKVLEIYNYPKIEEKVLCDSNIKIFDSIVDLCTTIKNYTI
jgi:7-cyano-7-deazaguanine tRNA-ribosyltransferase